MSDTPRTDNVQSAFSLHDPQAHDAWEHARTLERELRQLRSEVEKAWDEGARAAVNDYMIDAKKWIRSRAKRVSEGEILP